MSFSDPYPVFDVEKNFNVYPVFDVEKKFNACDISDTCIINNIQKTPSTLDICSKLHTNNFTNINRSSSLCNLADYQKKLFNENKYILSDVTEIHKVIINQQTMIENLQSQLNIMIPKLESINDNIYNLNTRYSNDLTKVKNKCYQDSLFNKGYISEFEQRFDHVDNTLQDLDQEVELLKKNKN